MRWPPNEGSPATLSYLTGLNRTKRKPDLRTSGSGSVSRDRKLVLHVANYDRRKNQRLALQAFLEAAPGDAVLVFMGSRLSDYARGLQRMHEQQHGDRQEEVLFLEGLTQSEIRSAYSAADLFLCSSHWEAQPLVVLDAMGAGLPFISTDVGCVREFPGGVIAASQRDMAEQITALAERSGRAP